MFNNVLISIDELFDVRTGVWQSITTPQDFVKMLDEGYGVRKTDRWDQYAPYSRYEEQFKKRDSALLRQCSITSILPLLDSILLEIAETSHANPTAKTPLLFIDFPARYELSDDEINVICGNIAEALTVDIPINVLRSKRVFTPMDFAAMEISIVFMYDMVKWFETVVTTTVLDKNAVSPFTTVACALVHTSELPYNTKTLEKAGDFLKEHLAPCVTIQYIPSAMFTSPIIVDLYKVF